MAGSGREVTASEELGEASLEKKYGGIAPKKKPLISKYYSLNCRRVRTCIVHASGILYTDSKAVRGPSLIRPIGPFASKRQAQRSRWRPYGLNCSPRLISSCHHEGQLADPWETIRRSRCPRAAGVENGGGCVLDVPFHHGRERLKGSDLFSHLGANVSNEGVLKRLV